MKRLICALTASAAVTLLLACNYHASPEPNTSKSEQQAQRVKTPSGGGPEATDQQSAHEGPATADNTQQGSAVPPAPADQTRPHPQPTRSAASSGPPSTSQR